MTTRRGLFQLLGAILAIRPVLSPTKPKTTIGALLPNEELLPAPRSVGEMIARDLRNGGVWDLGVEFSEDLRQGKFRSAGDWASEPQRRVYNSNFANRVAYTIPSNAPVDPVSDSRGFNTYSFFRSELKG